MKKATVDMLIQEIAASHKAALDAQVQIQALADAINEKEPDVFQAYLKHRAQMPVATVEQSLLQFDKLRASLLKG
jgi:phage gp36-like protein